MLSSSRPSWTSVIENILPVPFSFTRSIMPTLFLWQTGHIVLGGKKCLPQLLHFTPTRLYLLGFSLQNLGAVAISDPPQKMNDDSRPCASDIVRQTHFGIDHLSLSSLCSQLGHDLHGLSKTSGPDRVAPRLTPTRGIHRYLA